MQELTRRDLLTQTLPAAAALGTGLLSLAAMAQPAGGGGSQQSRAIFANGEYQLPPLPYAYEALEPHIDGITIKVHHDEHHKAYVNGLNKTLKAITELTSKAGAGGELDAARLAGLERDLSFHGGGHMLHSIFWETMAPKAGGAPQGALAEAIAKQYGSFDAFKTYFSKVAAGIKGSGWALLSYEPVGDQLMAFAINEHDVNLIPGAIPLLPLDVWEHAYYLKYQNLRADFIAAWWNVVNWKAVGDAYVMFRQLVKSGPAGGGAAQK